MNDEHLTEADGGLEDRPFSVLCISCGARMRDDKSEDSLRQCWKCFYRTLNDYLRAQRGSANPLFASDR